MIYLDNAATTALSPDALETLIQVSREVFGNPSSIHHFGRKANQVLRQARQTIATSLETHPNHIIFTSGGSEANTLAIQGYALANQNKGKHIITSKIEHHSVLHAMEYLEKRFGFEVTYLDPVDQAFTAQQVQEALRPDTILVSIMYANNETGSLLPIAEIGQILSDHSAVFHVDAVQVIGKIPVQPEKLGIDLLSASAHKFHGPKGSGFLYSRLPKFDSIIHGGKQESEKRAGTENLPAIAAMASALKACLENQKTNYDHVVKLRHYLIDKLDSDYFYLNETEETLPYIVNLGLKNQLNEQVLMQLDLAGIAVSSGSACTAGVIQKSHVLAAFYGPDSSRLTESIRISFSETNTYEEIDTLIKKLNEIIGGPF